jgi:hypothetical protein
MTNWNEAIRLNNHAVLLMHTGNPTDDETVIRNLQQAVTHFQVCIREEMISPEAANQDCKGQKVFCTVAQSSRQITYFQYTDFFLFDRAFLLFEQDEQELDGVHGSATLAKKAWIKSQGAVVLFNLALTFHRRANLRYLYANDPFKREQCDANFLSDTRSLFEKSRLLYKMANAIVGGCLCPGTEDVTDLFEGTRFALRLGIANNLVHISACTNVADEGGHHQHDVTYQVQNVARIVEEGVTTVAYRHLPFSILSGIMMNIVSRTDGVPSLFAPAA